MARSAERVLAENTIPLGAQNAQKPDRCSVSARHESRGPLARYLLAAIELNDQWPGWNDRGSSGGSRR